jgi:hypothetical protein
MTLADYSLDQIGRWENTLNDAANELKKIREGMKQDGISAMPLEATKASTYIDYLLPWAIQSEARFRQHRARSSATNTRSTVAKKKARKRR